MQADKSGRRDETLEYLQAMLGQLRVMADAEHCEMLTYLIEMAYIEAGDVIDGARRFGVRERKSR